MYPQMKRHMLITLKSKDSATLQVKVFARLTFGNQVFWFRETFLQIKLPAPKFYAPWCPKRSQLGRLLRQNSVEGKGTNTAIRDYPSFSTQGRKVIQISHNPFRAFLAPIPFYFTSSLQPFYPYTPEPPVTTYADPRPFYRTTLSATCNL